MIALIVSFLACAVLGAAVLWWPGALGKSTSYALLLCAVAWLSVAGLGHPRPAWLGGVQRGQLVGHYIDEMHGAIYLWVLHGGEPIALVVPFELHAAKQLQAATAHHGPVMIGKGSHGHGSGRVPFRAYPMPWQPGPPKGNP